MPEIFYQASTEGRFPLSNLYSLYLLFFVIPEISNRESTSSVIPEIFYQASTEEDVFPSSVVFCIFCFFF